jgi:hypothetical protein
VRAIYQTSHKAGQADSTICLAHIRTGLQIIISFLSISNSETVVGRGPLSCISALQFCYQCPVVLEISCLRKEGTDAWGRLSSLKFCLALHLPMHLEV